MRTLLTASALLLAAGCETVESADIRTGGVNAIIEVEADGTGQSVVTATLRSGGGASNTYLELTGGDRLVAATGSREKEMAESRDALDQVHYVAGFVEDRPGTRFRVAFERPDDNGEDAPASLVTLPPAFRLLSPAAGRLVVPDDDTLRIEWSDRGPDPVRVRLSGDCIQTVDEWLDEDRGHLTLDAGELETRGRDSCRVDVEVLRIRTGDLDPNFGEGGRIEARQARRTYIVVRP